MAGARRTTRRFGSGCSASHGLTWPWESLHVEALAWFDHWLKDADTGIIDGPPIRYWLPGAEELREAEAWPPSDARYVELALRADGALATDEGEPGTREYLQLPDSLDRPKGVKGPGLPSLLTWETPPLSDPLELVGEIELRLDASTTAADTGCTLGTNGGCVAKAGYDACTGIGSLQTASLAKALAAKK